MRIAVITAFADIFTAKKLGVNFVIFFNNDLKYALESSFGSNIKLIHNFRYSKLKALRKLRFLDYFLIQFQVKSENEYLFFSNHDCECLAILVSKNYKMLFYNNYPSINFDSYDSGRTSFTKMILDSFSGINLLYKYDDYGNLIKFINLESNNVKFIGCRQVKRRITLKKLTDFKRLIFLDDNMLSDVKAYEHIINLYKVKNDKLELCIKPRYSNVSFLKQHFCYCTILDHMLPIELMVFDDDLLIGSYSTAFEYFPDQSESILSLLKEVKPTARALLENLNSIKAKSLNVYSMDYLND